jgi:hypothetical protein
VYFVVVKVEEEMEKYWEKMVVVEMVEVLIKVFDSE